MSSNNVNWRQRMADKQRREKEAMIFAAEQERAKHAVLNETNFPTRLGARSRMNIPMLGFADRAHAGEIKDQVDKRMQQYRKQRAEMDAHTNHQFASGVVPLHRPRRNRNYEEESVEVEVVPVTLDERFPSHGRRRRTTPPDYEGWREVTRYYRKKRMMTDAELERKARAEILGEEDEEDDVNGDLGDRNQRREFY